MMGEWIEVKDAPAKTRGVFYIQWLDRDPAYALGHIERYPDQHFCIADNYPADVPATH